MMVIIVVVSDEAMGDLGGYTLPIMGWNSIAKRLNVLNVEKNNISFKL